VSASVGVEQPASERPARREYIPLGIAYMIGATLVFAGSSALLHIRRNGIAESGCSDVIRDGQIKGNLC